VQSGASIDYMKLTTNLGRSVSGGVAKSGSKVEQLGDVRILSLSGTNGWYLSTINIDYVDNYKPSKVVEKKVPMIIETLPGNQEVTQFSSAENATAASTVTVNKTHFGVDANASVEAEYGATFKASVDMKYSTDSREKVSTSVMETLKTSTKTKIKIPDGSVGVRVVLVDIMQSADGGFWVSPAVTLPNEPLATLPEKTAADSLCNTYDLTGTADVQIPNLRSSKETRNGLVYYGDRKTCKKVNTSESVGPGRTPTKNPDEHKPHAPSKVPAANEDETKGVLHVECWKAGKLQFAMDHDKGTKRWTETNQKGAVDDDWRADSRDQGSIYLVKPGNKLQLDLDSKKCTWDRGGKLTEFNIRNEK
jgi:hypothetical protein